MENVCVGFDLAQSPFIEGKGQLKRGDDQKI